MAGWLAAASNGVSITSTATRRPSAKASTSGRTRKKRACSGRSRRSWRSSYVLHTPEHCATRWPAAGRQRDSPYRAGPFSSLLPLNARAGQLARSTARPCRNPQPNLPALAPAKRHALDRRRTLHRQGAQSTVIKAGGSTWTPDACRSRPWPRSPAPPLFCARLAGCRMCMRENLRVGGYEDGARQPRHGRQVGGRIGSRAVCQTDCSVLAEKPRHVRRPRRRFPDTATIAPPRSSGISRPSPAAFATKLESFNALPTRQNCRRCYGTRKTRSEGTAYQACTLRGWRLHDEVLAATGAGRACPPSNRTPTSRMNRFDTGDVQADGLRISRGRPATFTETGASYMGFARCDALLASAMASKTVGAPSPATAPS